MTQDARGSALVALAGLSRLKRGFVGDVLSVDDCESLAELGSEDPRPQTLAEILMKGASAVFHDHSDDPKCSVCLRPDYNLPKCDVCGENMCGECSVLCEEHDEMICKECAIPIKKNRHDQLERPARGEKPDYYLCRQQWAAELENQLAEVRV